MVGLKVREAKKLQRELKDFLRRMVDLRKIQPDILDEMEQQNSGVNFNRDHPSSILVPTAFGARIGASHPRQSYGDVLDIDTDPLGDIVKTWIVGAFN